MRHRVRLRPEGRYQCTGCRAAWTTEERARASRAECAGELLAHGPRCEREHVLYPYSYDRGDGYGPDRLCDVVDCWLCVGHGCDCDVCTDQLDVPDLKILNDSQEHGNKRRSPNWEREEAMDDLKKMLSMVTPGTWVTASGRDTRGHDVTREGTLLAEPTPMQATHNGGKVPALRVCVGETGTDPATRQTWVTLIPGHGEIRRAAKPTGWQHAKLADIAAVRADRSGVSFRLQFGGKGGKRASEPAADSGTVAVLSAAPGGRYEIRAEGSGDVLWEGALQGSIWWAYVPEDNEHQDQERGAEHDGGETSYGKPVYHVRTGALVGYWEPRRFTPIEEIQD